MLRASKREEVHQPIVVRAGRRGSQQQKHQAKRCVTVGGKQQHQRDSRRNQQEWRQPAPAERQKSSQRDADSQKARQEAVDIAGQLQRRQHDADGQQQPRAPATAGDKHPEQPQPGQRPTHVRGRLDH